MSQYGPKNKQEFYDESLKAVEKNISTFERRTSENHTGDHKSHTVRGMCIRCGWLDPKSPRINAKGPDGLSILEHAKGKLESFKLAKNLMAKMTPDELFALSIFVIDNYGRGLISGGDVIEGLLISSLLAGAALHLSEEDLDLEQDLGFAEFLARHKDKPVD